MSTPDLSAFNFSFDPTLDTWAVSNEPAELDSSEIFLPNVEGRTEFLPPDPDRVPVIENSVRTDDPTYAVTLHAAALHVADHVCRAVGQIGRAHV